MYCIAITGHYIDSAFQLHSELLTLENLEANHTGPYLASIVFDVLDQYNLAEKLFCITTDNASNNFTMSKELENLLHNIDVDWDSSINHIPCLAHIINLVVQAFLNTLLSDKDAGTTFKTLLDKLRKIAKSIGGSAL